jgi:hypothetical protein
VRKQRTGNLIARELRTARTICLARECGTVIRNGEVYCREHGQKDSM